MHTIFQSHKKQLRNVLLRWNKIVFKMRSISRYEKKKVIIFVLNFVLLYLILCVSFILHSFCVT